MSNKIYDIEPDYDVTPKEKPDYSHNPICENKKCKNNIPDLAVSNNDTFCSSPCAREFHGTQLVPHVYKKKNGVKMYEKKKKK